MTVSRRGLLGAAALAATPLRAVADASPAAPVVYPAPELARVQGNPSDALRPDPDPDRAIAPGALAAAQAISDRFGGSSLLVWRDGRLVHETYAPGFDAATPLATFSMAKSVLAMTFGLAVTRGVVDLDAPVSRHLTEWRGDPRGSITLRQLMQMRSGLKLYSMGLHEPGAVTLMFGRDIAGAALATPLVRPPGETFEYANVNCFLAGLALDRALIHAGEGRYIDFLSRELWRPLGQNDATIDVDGPNGVPRFFAGLNATAQDWLRLGTLFVDEGRSHDRRILTPDWLRTMTTPSPNPAYGLFIWLGSPWTPLRSYGPRTPMKVACREPYLASDLVFFDGAGGQRLYAAPSRRLVVVRTGKASLEWDDSALPNAILRGFV